MVEDLRAMGAPQDVIDEHLRRTEQQEHFEVLPDNWTALNVFLAMSTQWRSKMTGVTGGFISVRTGLDYAALEALMQMQGITNSATVFQQVQTMEYAALEAMN